MRSLSNVLICGTGWCCEAGLLRTALAEDQDSNRRHRAQRDPGARVGRPRWLRARGAYLRRKAAQYLGRNPSANAMDVSVTRGSRAIISCRCLWQGVRRRDPALIELAAYYLVPFALLIELSHLAAARRNLDRFLGRYWPLIGRPDAAGVRSDRDLFHSRLSGGWVLGDASARSRRLIVRARRVVVYSLYVVAFSVLVWPPALVWALLSVAKSDWLYHTPHVSDVKEAALAPQPTS